MKVVIMPRIDEVQETGEVVEWFKREGDEVKENEVIAEGMTQKIQFDIVAPVSGELHKIFVEEATAVPIGTPIALIAEPGDDERVLSETLEKIKSEQIKVKTEGLV